MYRVCTTLWHAAEVVHNHTYLWLPIGVVCRHLARVCTTLCLAIKGVCNRGGMQLPRACASLKHAIEVTPNYSVPLLLIIGLWRWYGAAQDLHASHSWPLVVMCCLCRVLQCDCALSEVLCTVVACFRAVQVIDYSCYNLLLCCPGSGWLVAVIAMAFHSPSREGAAL